VTNINEVPPQNRAERRFAGKKARAAGAALTAGSAALAMGAAWIGTGIESAHAASTFTVTQATDDGTGGTSGSLSWAITQANGDAGSTIAFTVSGPQISVTGDLPQVTAPTTIAGPGASALTIEGNSHKLFDFKSAGTSTVSGLTITHGSAQFGGGVNATGTDLTLDGDVITANTSVRDGGGVSGYNHGSIDIKGTTISGNTSHEDGGGGAFYHLSSVTVTGSTVTDNTAIGKNSDGGGLYVYGEDTTGGAGTVSIDSTTISGNTADDNGGGVYVSETLGASISNSNITNNTEKSLSGSHGGGGVMLDDLYGGVSISATTISGNTAPAGGGVYVEDLFGDLTVSDSNLSANHATAYWGGGLYLNGLNGAFSMTNTTVANNTAAEDGGGVSIDSSGSATSVTVTDSTISGNVSSADGGGWAEFYTGAPTSFFNSTISGNTASGSGGGIFFYGNSGLALTQTTIAANSAPVGGGVEIPTPETIKSTSAVRHHEAKAADTEVNSHAAAKGATARASRATGQGVHATASTFGAVTSSGTIISQNSGGDVAEAGTLAVKSSILGAISGTVLTDQGGNQMGVDPLLGPLASNGGPTQTMALLFGSPAIDAGPNPLAPFTGSDFDQRGPGYARVVNGQTDVGAFEVQPAPIEIAPKFTG